MRVNDEGEKGHRQHNLLEPSRNIDHKENRINQHKSQFTNKKKAFNSSWNVICIYSAPSMHTWMKTKVLLYKTLRAYLKMNDK